MTETTKEKTVYELELHETLELKTNIGGKIEVTRVPGGWVYAFEYPGFRQSPVVFVPFFGTEGWVRESTDSEVKKTITKKGQLSPTGASTL